MWQEMQMNRLLLAVPLLFVAFAASADPVYTITNMSCSAVQGAVRDNGSVILRWRSKSGTSLYGRYVSDRRFCRPGEIINFASVPAADKSCNVKKCVYKVRDY
ncbi:hypothetical protein [Mesorhizobium sp. KR9-304]|uniref:hypothetical protein n=1 Tax=Mesorhizobium sp. KR9-304 TaxID=3156614 RepID=UPI0032B49EC1